MEGRIHHGIDFAAPKGTPIHAAASGRVTYAGFNRGSGYGNMVEINHGSQIVTRYAHMSGTAVYKGQEVEQGDVIGYVGSTGDSTGPHLHFEVMVNGNKVDPEPFIKGEPITAPGVPDTGGPFGAITDFVTGVQNVVQFLTNPGNWYRIGLFLLGLLLIVGGVWFFATRNATPKFNELLRRVPK